MIQAPLQAPLQAHALAHHEALLIWGEGGASGATGVRMSSWNLARLYGLGLGDEGTGDGKGVI